MSANHIGASPDGKYFVAGLETSHNSVIYKGGDLKYTYENE